MKLLQNHELWIRLQKRSFDEDNFDSAGNKIKIGDTVGGDDMKPVIDTPTGKDSIFQRKWCK